MMNTVSFYRAEKYDVETLVSVVDRIIRDHGGYERLFEKGKKTVIKPNLVVRKKPEGCATTHPAVLEAVLLCLLPHTKDITVAECPGGPNTEPLLHGIYRETGIAEICEKYGIPIHTQMNPRRIPVPCGLSAKEVDVLDVFCEADVFINLAKMKTHSLTTVTGCAKNLYGLIPGLRKIEYHAAHPEIYDFSGLIIDLNRALPPTLSILDGIWGMEKDGPSGGIPKFGGTVLGGVSTFAIDEVMCRRMGIDPTLSPILERAKKEGVFSGEVQIVGDDETAERPEPFLLPDSKKPNILRDLPKIFGGRLGRFLSPKPKIVKKNCIGCGECASLCPQKTIEIKNRKAVIHPKKCIRCWCCQEMCPKKAVKTSAFGLLRWM
ncbi:MAG: DUF362 domain-containing protein [Clostridia bacterium]|nr:DUF362 domain-containing protein [Clostridia bacterium]